MKADDLPAFVVLHRIHAALPTWAGIINWGAAFLPVPNTRPPRWTHESEATDLPIYLPPKKFAGRTPQIDHDQLEFLQAAQSDCIQQFSCQTNSEWKARIKAYEMAARLQTECPK